MSIWRRGALTDNPYNRTAFRVGRVTRETTRQRVVAQRIGQTRRLVKTDPQAHTILGEPVSEAEVNSAEQVLMNPLEWTKEELLHHAAEEPHLERIRDLMREVEEAIETSDAKPMRLTNDSGIRLWAHQFVCKWLKKQSVPNPSFGALELELTPPFGRLEGD